MSYLSRQMWAGGSIKVGGVSEYIIGVAPGGGYGFNFRDVEDLQSGARGHLWTQRVGPSGP